MTELTLQELIQRREKFIALMNSRFPRWNSAVFMESVNKYYFTATIQDGVLLIQRDGSLIYGVRRSLERALEESPLPQREIIGISTYRDLAQIQGGNLEEVYVEGDTMPIVTKDRLAKYFNMNNVGFLDSVVRTVRSIKSPYELEAIRQSGEAHRKLLEENVPALLREGMTEHEFLEELSREMLFGHFFLHFFQSVQRFIERIVLFRKVKTYQVIYILSEKTGAGNRAYADSFG